jgi:hypothetical protein
LVSDPTPIGECQLAKRLGYFRVFYRARQHAFEGCYILIGHNGASVVVENTGGEDTKRVEHRLAIIL